MTQERIQFFENLLSKPMAEPHRGWIEELLQAVKPSSKQPKPKPAFRHDSEEIDP